MSVLRCLTDDELPLIQPLFNSVFGAPIGADLLSWKYAQGRGRSWSLWQNGQLQVHCGLCRREICLQGEQVWAEQLVDLMAAPKQAGLARRSSPFFVLMDHLLEQIGGPGNPDRVAFGFPSARAMRLGVFTGVYEAVDQWLELGLSPRKLAYGPHVAEIVVWGGWEMRVVNRLWLGMRDSLQEFAVGVRDMSYVEHRYLMHPEKKYRFLLVKSRWRRLPVGLLVLAPGQGTLELLDMICAWDDVAEVLLAAKRWQHACGIPRLVLNLTSHFAVQLAQFSDTCVESQFLIMGNPRMSTDVRQKLAKRWWLTGGDTDYR